MLCHYFQHVLTLCRNNAKFNLEIKHGALYENNQIRGVYLEKKCKQTDRLEKSADI